MSYFRCLPSLFGCCAFLWLSNIYANTDSLTRIDGQSSETSIKMHSNTLADQKKIELVKQYIKENKGKEALQVLSPMLINSSSYDIFLLTAQSYAEINNPSVSIDFFQKARELADTDEKRQVASQGIAKMQYWLSQSPNTFKVLSPNETMDLARKYIDANQGSQALETLNPLLLNKPSYDTLILLAQSYAVVNNPLLSLELYKKALEMAQNDMQRQVANTGIQKMQIWLNQTSAKQLSTLELARKYNTENKETEALKLLEPLLVNSPDYEVLLLTAQTYAELNNPSSALSYYEKAGQQAKNDIQRKIADSGIQKMQAWFEESNNERHLNNVAAKAKEYINENKEREALKLLEPLLVNSPDYEVLLLTAQAHAELNNPSSALSYYEKAGQQAKTDMQRKIADSGIQKMKAWLEESHSDKHSNDVNQAKKYINENKGKEALELLKPLLDNSPNYEVLLLTAQGYAGVENPSSALLYYEKAKQQAKTNTQQKIANSGIEKMKEWLSQTQEGENASSLDAAMEHARKYINANKGEEALKVLQPFAKLTNFDVFILMAQSYAVLNNPATSLKFYKQAGEIAKTKTQQQIVDSGVAKMKAWLGGSEQKKAKSPLDKALDLVRKYLAEDKGRQALEIIEPLVIKHPNYTVFILAAQSYSSIEKPRIALAYYKLALSLAKTKSERVVANFGLAKTHLWLSQYYRAQYSYERILQETDNKQDYELALAGKVKSLAYENRPIAGFRSIPPNFRFTTPQMVVAAAQASLWSDWADITKNIVTSNKAILDKIPPKSLLSKDLKDLTWQMNQATWPNIISPLYYYFGDSEQFRINREVLDYSHYWSQLFQSSIGVRAAQYRQHAASLDAKSIYIGQTWRPTRQLTFFGQIEPADYSLWNPTLWIARGNYRPNDYLGLNVNLAEEVVETFRAFANQITYQQSSASLVLNPLPYIQFDGAVNQLEFSDTNQRKGYYVAASAIISPVYGLKLIVQERGFSNKFVSRLYFSPNRYVTDTVILRYSSKAGSVWHYYIDGGLGCQLVRITDVPSSRAPTHQFGFGINGPINNWLIISAYYSISNQATSFIDSTNYRSQSGSVSLKILL